MMRSYRWVKVALWLSGGFAIVGIVLSILLEEPFPLGSGYLSGGFLVAALLAYATKDWWPTMTVGALAAILVGGLMSLVGAFGGDGTAMLAGLLVFLVGVGLLIVGVVRGVVYTASLLRRKVTGTSSALPANARPETAPPGAGQQDRTPIAEEPS